MSNQYMSVKDIEDAMADVLLHPEYTALVAEYERLLSIMGNVDGNEVIALVMVAHHSIMPWSQKRVQL